MVIRYELLLDPGKPLDYKTKYLHDAENDEQALEQSQAYAKKKGWEIARLTREVKEAVDLIPFDHSRRE